MLFPAAIGRSGITKTKKEGDFATPAGYLPLRRVFYRADRVFRPETNLPCRPVKPCDGWCDDPNDINYNRLIRRPYTGRHETLMRDDAAYDIVVVLGWNDVVPKKNRGSAIFLHMTPECGTTAGCIGLSAVHLRQFLAHSPTGIFVPETASLP